MLTVCKRLLTATLLYNGTLQRCCTMEHCNVVVQYRWTIFLINKVVQSIIDM
jgi:hypothetical protein